MSCRSAVFIDGGHLSKVLQDLGHLRVDYAKMTRKISVGTTLLRSYYYDCLPYQSNPPSSEEEYRMQSKSAFFDALRRLSRFEVRQGFLLFKGTDSAGHQIFEQKGVDTWMVVDLIRLSVKRRVQAVILLAGDGDFIPAVNYVKDLGVEVHLFCGNTPNARYSVDLWEKCDERTTLDREYFADCLLQ